MEICAIVASVDMFPHLVGYINQMKANFPGMIHKCPYTSLLVINASMKNVPEGALYKTHETPNGLQRSTLMALNASFICANNVIVATSKFVAVTQLFDEFDDNIYQTTVLMESKKPGRTFDI